MQATATAAGSSASLLQRVVRANGVFCMVSGVGAVAGAAPLASLLGFVQPLALVVVGLVLLAYGGLVFWLAGQPGYLRPVAIVATALDEVWVFGSLVLLFGGWLTMWSVGWWLVAVLALIVADFALVQMYALWRLWRR
jgi:hypothetical protein